MIVLASILLPLHIIIKEGQNQMTEWEKLQQGVIYNDFDEDFVGDKTDYLKRMGIE